MIRRSLVCLFASMLALVTVPAPQAVAAPLAARGAEPVVMTGAQVPSWSRLAAVGEPTAWPKGTGGEAPLDPVRDAHHGTVHIPPDARAGVAPADIAAFRWDAATSRFVEVPVQVDERFPYFLANGNSDFSLYSSVDEEVTYAWDVESWKKTAGQCSAAYPAGQSATADPVATLDDDDEIAFMASDTGPKAPEAARGPVATQGSRQEVAVADPTDPAAVRYVYLFLRPGGSAFDATNGYVSYQRDDNADEWIDRNVFSAGDPEQLGSSNTGYGPNISGTVCRTAGTSDTTARNSTDRFPRDGVTVSTDAYQWRATGRWMVRGMRIAKPGHPREYGPDLIDRWKGRAFQQSPDSEISVVGFEDEQVNWEANSALLGERTGPVRAIRETWGADSGTNVTKTETYYRDAVTYRYHTRVHPIPSDGIYFAWDYNHGVATKYFNTLKPDGVDIDGKQDDVGTIDDIAGFPAFFDAPDPTFNVLTVTDFWDQVSGAGDGGSLVYVLENKGPTSAENPLAFPYYRDDKCFDDGTGDDPVARPWPGEASTDTRVRAGYAALAGKPYEQVGCDEKQGSWGASGVHVFFTGDTDNAFQSKPATEMDAQQWQFAVPTNAPAAVGEPYANVVRAPLRPQGFEQTNVAAKGTTLAITAPQHAQITDGVHIEARLLDSDGPIKAATVHFAFQGHNAERTTNDDGVASLDATVTGPAETSTMRVEFDGDGSHGHSAAEQAFTAERDDSRIAFTAKAGKKKTVVVTAKLTDADDNRGLGSRTLRVLVDGRQSTTVATGGDGAATATLALPKPKGHELAVAFDGDDTYLGAVAAGTFGTKGASASG